MAASEGSAAPSARHAASAGDSVTIAIGTALHEADRALILATLAHCRGVRKRTAAMLGISLKTLYNRLVSYRKEA